MTTLSKTAVIHVPAADVFALITDPERVQPLIPGLTKVWEVSDRPLQRGSTFSWEFQFLGVPFRGTWKVESLRLPNYYVGLSTGGIESRWVYVLVTMDDRTVTTLAIEYGTPTSLLKQYAMKFVEPHTEKLAEAYLASLKSYLELNARNQQKGGKTV